MRSSVSTSKALAAATGGPHQQQQAQRPQAASAARRGRRGRRLHQHGRRRVGAWRRRRSNLNCNPQTAQNQVWGLESRIGVALSQIWHRDRAQMGQEPM